MSRRLSLLGPPVLTAQTAHFPPPSGFCHRLCHRLDRPTCRCRRQRFIRHSVGASDSRPTLPPAVLSSDLCFISLPPFFTLLTTTTCPRLGTNLEKPASSTTTSPIPPIRPPPETALCNKKSALRSALRLPPCPALAFPSHSRTRSTSLLHPPKGRSRESKINNQSCAIAVRGSLLYRLVSPRNPTKQLDSCSRPLASRHHCPSSTMATAVRQPFAPLDGARLQTLTSLKNRQNCRPSSSPGSVLLLTDSCSHRERPRQAKGRRGRGGWLGERGPDALF